MTVRVLVCVLIMFPVVYCAEKTSRTVNDGLITTLTNGVKFAKDVLGTESIALKVAEFVVKAFQPRKPTNRRPYNNQYAEKDRYFDNDKNNDSEEDYNEETTEKENVVDPLRHIVRLFGLQPPQMSAAAINALLFVAQMISTFLSGPRKTQTSFRSGDPSSWILNKNSRGLQDIIANAKNESLPELIENIIEDQGNEEDTSCIRLLVCKLTPFITKMQKTVFGQYDEKTANENKKKDENYRGASIMYRHLPTNDEVNMRSEYCERLYPLCDLNN